MSAANERRRACSLAARVKLLVPPADEAHEATVVELGEDTLVARLPVKAGSGSLIALDLQLPGARELHAIVKVVGAGVGVDEVLCENTFLPQLERGLIRRWMDDGPPPGPAARLRLGRVG